MSSDADTDSKYFLLQDGLLLALEVLNDGKDSRILLGLGRTSPSIKVLNVPTGATTAVQISNNVTTPSKILTFFN